jgi:phage shock protein A
MGVLGRLRQAISSVLPERTPAREIEATLAALEQHQAAAIAELVAYKTFEKDAAKRAEALTARVQDLERKAALAVRAGSDDLAREALLAARDARQQGATLAAERATAAGEAKQLLEARRALAQRITAFELKKHTLAGQLSVARGGGSVLRAEGKHWDALARAEERIAEADALAELEGDAIISGSSRVDEALEELRAKRALDELKARLPAGELPKKSGR